MLALFLSKGMLPEVRMKQKENAQLHSLAARRDKLVKQRTALVNKIHSVLNSYSLTWKKETLTTEKDLQRILGFDWDTIVKVELEVLAAPIRSLTNNIKRLDHDILLNTARNFKAARTSAALKGSGKNPLLLLLSVIGNVKDFATEDKLAAYLGIVPRVKDSNEASRHGWITKHGSALARTTLVQCALVAKQYSPYLRDDYERIKRTRGSGKAIIVTARKLLGIIYKTLTNGWVFKDFPNFVIATT